MKLHPSEKIPGCEHFEWQEFLWLPQWRVMVYPSSEIAANLVVVARKMEKIRELLGNKPITVTSGFRPKLYNKKIGGAEFSAHMKGLACDFQHSDLKAMIVRERLYPHLEDLKIRMENLPSANWVHIDLKEPGFSGRYFMP